jgi:hypothetical protein
VSVPAVVTAMGGAPGARGVDRLVLLAIASFADPDGSNCFPSLEGIAERANMSARNAQRAIRRLRTPSELGAPAELEVRPREGGRGRNLYVIRALEEAAPGDATSVVASEEIGATAVVAPTAVDATTAVAPTSAQDLARRQLGLGGRQIGPGEATPVARRGDSSSRTTIQDHPRDHAGPSSARERLRALGCDLDHPQAEALLEHFADEDAALALRVVSKSSGARGATAARRALFLLGEEERRGTLDAWRATERERAA